MKNKTKQDRHLHKGIVILSLFFIFLLSACTNVNSPVGSVTETVMPTETTAPIATPTETPIPTPTPEPGLVIDRKNFPDSGFRDYVLDHFDSDYDEVLSDEEIQNVKAITLPQKGIESLEGIQFFSQLTELDCSGNSIKKLNLKENKSLKSISCQDNPDLSELLYPTSPGYVTFLDCSNTSLTALDTCTQLKKLSCNNTRIKELVFKTGSLLEELYCYQGSYRALSVLDIAGCTKLKTIIGYYGGSQLILNNPNLSEVNLNLSALTKTVDVSGCEKLRKLILFYDYWSGYGGQIVKATNLNSLWLANICFDADAYIGIPKSDLAESVDLSGCKNLEWVDCYGARKLNVSGCSNIEQLNHGDSTKVSGYKK